MMEAVDMIIRISALFGAVGALGGAIVAIVVWVQKPKKNKEDISELRKTHEEDMKTIKDELCVMSYAMLASLDGLKQLHCNGEVTKAHDELEKHLNKRAHY